MNKILINDLAANHVIVMNSHQDKTATVAEITEIVTTMSEITDVLKVTENQEVETMRIIVLRVETETTIDQVIDSTIEVTNGLIVDLTTEIIIDLVADQETKISATDTVHHLILIPET